MATVTFLLSMISFSAVPRFRKKKKIIQLFGTLRAVSFSYANRQGSYLLEPLVCRFICLFRVTFYEKDGHTSSLKRTSDII